MKKMLESTKICMYVYKTEDEEFALPDTKSL